MRVSIFQDLEPVTSLTLYQAKLFYALGMDSMVAGRPLMRNNTDCPTNDCRVAQYTSLASCADCEEQEFFFDDLWNKESQPWDLTRSHCYGDIEIYEELSVTGMQINPKLSVKATTEVFLETVENKTLGKNNVKTSLRLGCDIQRDGYMSAKINVTMTAEKLWEDLIENQSLEAFQELDGRGRCGDSNEIGVLPRNPAIAPTDCCAHPRSTAYEDINRPSVQVALNERNVITPFSCIKIDSTNRDDYNATAIEKLKVKLTWCKLSLCAEERTNVTIKSGTMDSETMTRSPIHANPNSERFFKDNHEFAISNSSLVILNELAVSFVDSTEFSRHEDYIVKNGWPDYFGTMAAVLTTLVQNGAQPTSERILAQAYATDTFMEVQWAWFSMPVFLLLSTILLLITTARRTAWKTYLFKSSALAIVFHGLESEASKPVEVDSSESFTEAVSRGTITSATLDKMAGECNVRFGPNANGELKLLKMD
jgi:hypothetical protein